MDEKVYNEAVENISLIKGVIDRTSRSFAAFSQIFIYWGLLFILNSVVNLVMVANKEQLLELSMRHPVLNYVFPVGVVALLAALIYWSITKRMPLVGLEKHLIKVWLLVLLMSLIPPKIIIHTAPAVVESLTVQTSNFSVMLFGLAIALITTALFTDFRRLMHVGLIYIGISVLYAYFNLPIFSDSVLLILYSVALPFTFLYTGFFLRTRQARGE